MTSFAVKQESIWAAIESAYNSVATIAATDVLSVENLQADPVNSVRIIERNIVNSSLAPSVPIYGGSLFGFTFDVEMKNGGAAGVAPRIGRLFRACGMRETVVASTSVTYEPDSDTSAHDSLTFFFREGDNLRKVTGARGSASLSVEAGQRFIWSFTFIGHILSEAEAAAPAETEEATTPPVFIGATFTLDGYAAATNKLAIDLGNTMSIAPDPNAADGFGQIRIGARKIAGSVDPEAQNISAKDYIAELRAGTEFAIATGVIGTGAGSRIAISEPRCRWISASPGDREALRIYDLGYSAHPTAAGDDDLALQFT